MGLVDAQVLKNFIAAINEVVSEATIWVEDGRLRFRGMDEAHVVLADLGAEADGCEIAEPVTISTADLAKFLKNVDGEVCLELVDKRLKIFGGDVAITVSIISDTDYRAMKNLDLRHECEGEVLFPSFKDAVDHAATINDYLRLSASGSGLVAEARSDYAELRRVIPTMSLRVHKEGVAASFSTIYLQKINNILKRAGADSIRIGFATNKPLEVWGEGRFAATVYLAPRIE